ncbi:glutathione transferase GstA [Crenobacter sp. SG2303]|uniref:Glutathione transferase GstA n=1 Tax=Crenobacter oryzisoli TaxID=3056844 RepID=A0ABT7XUH0_9NEIS|nr:glutathione transferase GstA [Crenobacter sp. SG2303]MDN0077199.1 glutathione transferase GstA [Crenobacter sp. SG2303]
MKLFYAPGACSLAPHIVLAETGLPSELEAVDLRVQPHRTAGGVDYAAINPKGYVPALQLDDGAVLTECVAVLQYLADQAPQQRLAPANGTMGRYRLQEWLNFIATEVHKGFSPLWNPAAGADEKAGAVQRLERRFAWLDTQLAGRDYLTGEFSIADAYLFTILNWTHYHKLSLDGWPTLKAYVERVATRPAVKSAMSAEGLLG